MTRVRLSRTGCLDGMAGRKTTDFALYTGAKNLIYLIHGVTGTPAEIEAMSDRWAVVEWLGRGAPYREIHKHTGVSLTTISRVARYLGDGNGGYELASARVAARSP